MDRLKIWFTDFWPEWKDEDFITPILSKHFEVVLDRNKPDVLFHSIFNRMSDTPNYKCKKVLILAENWRPSQFKSDYSISFDPHSQTNFRLPLWQIYLLLWPHLKDRLYNRLNYKEEQFERWCAFTVSNPSNFMRNSAYQMLNDYKRVHSYGKAFMNDVSLQKATEGRYWRDAKDEFLLKHPHKFMITYENTPYRYYCTEKLMDAFLVGSLPIYWGDTKVAEDWNKDAFIDVTRGDVNIVKDIDKDIKRFKTIYEQPVFTEEQKKKLEANLSNFENWVINIIKK
jgi:hypothetical protein